MTTAPTPAKPKKIKIETVDVTLGEKPRRDKTKWLEYRIDGVTIAEYHVFPMYGKMHTPGTLGRTFSWYHSNLREMFGDKYEAARDTLFNWKHQDLVYGKGGTIPLKRVKEIINTVANS